MDPPSHLHPNSDVADWEPSRVLLCRSTTMPTRRPLLAGLPVEYLEKTNQVPEDIIYDQRLRKFKYRDDKVVIQTAASTGDLVKLQDKTKEAIKKYEVRAKEEFKSRWKFDPYGSLDWTKVLRDLNAAIATYENKVKFQREDTKLQKCAAFFHRCVRALTAQATAVQGWLQICPNGDYGAIVCGALQIIFHAVARVTRVRDDLMDFIGDVTEIIIRMDSYGEIYKNQAKLQEQLLDFRVATLAALEHAIQWFSEKSSSAKFLSALGKQDEYGSELDSRSREFKRQVQRLKDAADLNLHKTTKSIEETVRMGRLENMEGRKEMAELRSDLYNIESNVQNLASDLGRVCELQVRMLNHYVDFLEANPKILKQSRRQLKIMPGPTSDRDDEGEAAFPRPRYSEPVNTRDLVHCVGDGYLGLANSSVQEALEEASRLSIEEQDRAEAIANSDLLKRFLASPDSDILLIQGNSAHNDPLSSTSVVAATLIKGLQELSVPVLHFFCGKHKTPDSTDPFLGPYGMMIALAQQFLALYRLEKLLFLDQSTAKFAAQNVQSLGDLIYKLAANDPSPITFCVIDGITSFENTPLEHATRTALRQLTDVVSKANGCFKLLILAPTRSTYVPETLYAAEALGSLQANQHNILHVQADLVHGSRRGVPQAVLAQSLSDSAVKPAKDWYVG